MLPKHFHAVDLDQPGPLDQRMGNALEAELLRFVLLWTKGIGVSLYALHVRVQGEAWLNVIPTVISDNDGETTVYLGSYAPGSALDIHFGAFAIDGNVTKMASFIVHGANGVQKLVPPGPSDFKSLKRGSTWEETASYVVPEATIV